MKLVYSDHAKKRMRQRGITSLEIELVLAHPEYVKKTFEGRKEAFAFVKNRVIRIVFIEVENYIRVITVL